MNKNDFLHGSVLKLTREDTENDIKNCFITMKENGLDTVVIWPSSFWWEEKKEGYPFNTGRKVLELAEAYGIKVIMELAGQLTIMEYIPDFLMKPEYLPTDENGQIIWGANSFGYLNYFHPEVNKLICENFTKTAMAYKDYPALIGYDVFNETISRSFDKYTIEEFRKWLRDKYKTIDKLNDVWERSYSDFSQVDYQMWKWMSVMPEADYNIFLKWSMGKILTHWCDAIRKADNEHMIVADNISSMMCSGLYGRPHDDYIIKETVGEVGISFYPKQVDGCQPPHIRWCVFEGLYSASKRDGFLISEMQTHIQALFNPTTAVRTYELKQWCLEGIASGAKALIYWMWRPFNKGLQTLGRGLVDYRGRSTPRLEVAKEISDIIKDCGVVKPVKSKIAILYDDMCDDFQRTYTKAYLVDQEIYNHSIHGAYGAFFENGICPDIIKVDEIHNYKAVILTNHLIISKETASILKKFVDNGGTLICDGKTGIVDEYSMLCDIIPGGDFNSYMGTEYIDTDYEGLDFSSDDKHMSGYYGRDIVEVRDAQVLANYTDSNPAVTRKQNGKGQVININTYLWYSYGKEETNTATEFAKELVTKLQLNIYDASIPVFARFCENDDEYVIFVFNYTNEDLRGCIKSDIYTGDVDILANDVIVIRRPKC